MTWVPIALGRDVPPGITRAVLLEGRELVIWRGEGGKAHVWEDRCPHRGMRLSLGFVRGNTLNCLYHGWQYGENASCNRIPAHLDLVVPATIRANVRQAAESGGLIWVGMQEWKLSSLREARPVATLAVEAGIEVIREAIDSMQHPGMQFLDAKIGGIPMHLGWHIPEPGRTLLHATHAGTADEAACLAALRELRDSAEMRQAA